MSNVRYLSYELNFGTLSRKSQILHPPKITGYTVWYTWDYSGSQILSLSHKLKPSKFYASLYPQVPYELRDGRPLRSHHQSATYRSLAPGSAVACITITVIWFYFVLYLISYAAVRTKLNVRIFFNNEMFTRVSYTMWGAYEIKIVRNNNVRNIFNAKYNQIMVHVSNVHSEHRSLLIITLCTPRPAIGSPQRVQRSKRGRRPHLLVLY